MFGEKINLPTLKIKLKKNSLVLDSDIGWVAFKKEEVISTYFIYTDNSHLTQSQEIEKNNIKKKLPPLFLAIYWEPNIAICKFSQ